MPALQRLCGCYRMLSHVSQQSCLLQLARTQRTVASAMLPQQHTVPFVERLKPDVGQLGAQDSVCPTAVVINQTPRRYCSECSSVSKRRQNSVCTASIQPTGGAAGSKESTVLTVPTILTLARVAAIPALIAAWFWPDPAATALVTGLFIAASVTDWLDGYLARKLNAYSAFGAFLDPVADKLMVATVLVLLCTQPLTAGPLAGNSWAVPVATLTPTVSHPVVLLSAVIIGREITMSALREWAATLGPAARAAVAVNSLGKWKTATQVRMQWQSPYGNCSTKTSIGPTHQVHKHVLASMRNQQLDTVCRCLHLGTSFMAPGSSSY
eukprot:GHRR01029818.1.p1 GENE.GHRR01029818.1~~GHRR01029818.1.p1  ORF type:complete len:325 (+),score=94.82 GHRR01029818.1:358-1332(+)